MIDSKIREYVNRKLNGRMKYKKIIKIYHNWKMKILK